MHKLNKARQEIDEIDEQMAALFERRMQAVTAVGEYKRANNLPVLDATREALVIEKNVARIQNKQLSSYYKNFIENAMFVSREYQSFLQGKNSVAYQGVEGGFGHQVASQLFPLRELMPSATFADVFSNVDNGRVSFGIVPFENSNTGDVSGILDLCYAHGCYITAMYDLPVNQNLLCLHGAKLSDIKKVYSHPQALEQSARFLKTLEIEILPYANTAMAAQFVAESGNKTLAAVASLQAAQRYGLMVLAENISTEADNTTRFIVIGKQPPQNGDRFSLLVTVENKVGRLAKIIEAIAEEGFDMEAIKSRPMPKRPWEYYFYIELVGAPQGDAMQALLKRIGEVCLSVRILGIYAKTVGQA